MAEQLHHDGEPSLSMLSQAQSKELARRRRGRNIAMLIALLAMSALFYAVAIVKLSRPDLG